jgi:hypothetical protein
VPDEDPIVLPHLAAHRRGASAAVCASGHVLAWHVEPDVEVGFCPKCGDRILLECPACHAALPPDPSMLQWVPYHSNCASCGKAYPWIAAEISRAKRTLAEQAEVEHWDEGLRARAEELVDDIAADRVTASGVVAALRWLAQRGATSAETAILEEVDKLASATLKQGLRPTFPGLF